MMRSAVTSPILWSSASTAVVGLLLFFSVYGTSLRADSCAENLSPQTVILDRFEARDATVADVLEALVLVAEKASKQAYRPNLVIVGDSIGQMKVSLKLKKAPLSDALDRIGELPGVQVTYRPNQTVIFSMKDG